jgi:hypothetical protein
VVPFERVQLLCKGLTRLWICKSIVHALMLSAQVASVQHTEVEPTEVVALHQYVPSKVDERLQMVIAPSSLQLKDSLTDPKRLLQNPGAVRTWLAHPTICKRTYPKPVRLSTSQVQRRFSNRPRIDNCGCCPDIIAFEVRWVLYLVIDMRYVLGQIPGSPVWLTLFNLEAYDLVPVVTTNRPFEVDLCFTRRRCNDLWRFSPHTGWRGNCQAQSSQ